MDHPHGYYVLSQEERIEQLGAENARLRAALTECADAYDIADVMEAAVSARKVLSCAELSWKHNVEPTSTTIGEVFRDLPDHLKP